jgi:hypothetical protein
MPAVTSSAVEAPEKPEAALRLNHHIIRIQATDSAGGRLRGVPS